LLNWNIPPINYAIRNTIQNTQVTLIRKYILPSLRISNQQIFNFEVTCYSDHTFKNDISVKSII
jgi:hypothetical protein